MTCFQNHIFLADLNEICCGSLLSSILRTEGNLLKHEYNFLMFFTLKLIKNVIFNKTKNTRVVSFFIYMSSMCVQLFTPFEVPVLKLYVPW